MDEEIDSLETNNGVTENELPPETLTDAENFAYAVLEDGVRIDSFIDRRENVKSGLISVIVPSTIENLPVLVIGEYAFKGRTSLKLISLPENTDIGKLYNTLKYGRARIVRRPKNKKEQTE